MKLNRILIYAAMACLLLTAVLTALKAGVVLEIRGPIY